MGNTEVTRGARRRLKRRIERVDPEGTGDLHAALVGMVPTLLPVRRHWMPGW